jgi:hypothetical protein
MSELKLTIEGEGISFKKNITEHRAGQIISLLSSEQSPLLDPIKKTVARNLSGKSSPNSRRNIREEVEALPIDTSMEGYPNYHDLPTKADKIIWVLQYAEQNGVKGLTSGEVDFLSAEFKDRIEAKNFGAFNGRNVRSSYIKKINGLFETQQKGLNYLASLVKK